MIGILLGLAFLMFLAYRGMSIVWVAPIAAGFVALTGGLNLLEAYMGPFMEGLVGFTKSWFPAFMLGAIFGKLMDVSGAARSIAELITKKIGSKYAILSVVLSCGLLTYGGISLFVVVFAMYPLALALFREANITRRLIPGTIALGAFTFTMTGIPGSPQIQNIIPTKYFGTTPSAAPILGIVASLIMLVGGVAWLKYRENKFRKEGIVFEEPEQKVEKDHENLPNPWLSLLPLAVVILLLNFAPFDLVPAMKLVLCLVAGIILSLILFWKRIDNVIKTINEGAAGSVMSILNTSSAVGFGTVVKSVPGFAQLTSIILGIKGPILVSEAVAVNVLAGATGSASGGMGIALEALGQKYLEIAANAGINPEALHRIASLSSGGLDTLPQNGAVLTLLAVTGMSHKESYFDIFMTCCVIPVAAVVTAIILATIGVV